MTPKEWLTYLGSELPPDDFKRAHAHLGSFIGPMRELPSRYMTSAVAAGVRIRIMQAGRLPNFPELKAMVLEIGPSTEPEQRAVSRTSGQPVDEGDRLKQRWLDYFHNRIAEGVQGAELANLVSLVRSQSSAAYDAIAEQHDHERWQEDRRRAADIMQRRHQMEQVAQQTRRRMAIPPPQSYQPSTIPQQPRPQHTVKTMTREQLDQAYRERGLIRPGTKTVQSERLD